MAELSQARNVAMLTCPYYRHVLLRMPVKITEDVPTMGVDKRAKLYVNPKFLESLSVAQAAGVLLHEVEHVVCGHARRCGARIPQLWNIAADAIINERLTTYTWGYGSHKIELPDDGIFCHHIPGSLPNMTPEEVYDLLKKSAKQITMPSYGGSCADGEHRPWEDASGDGLTQMEQGMLTRQVADAISKGIGNAPQSLKIELGVASQTESLEERVLRKIRTWGTTCPIGEHSTYTRLPRRPMPGFVTPGRYGIRPRLLMCWDTSGSMGDADHGLLNSVINTLLGMFREVLVVAGDTEAHFTKKVQSLQDIELTGRGGTDMSRLMWQAHEIDPKAAILVGTDGDTGWPDEKLPVPCFALTTRQSHCPMPDWIQVCELY